MSIYNNDHVATSYAQFASTPIQTSKVNMAQSMNLKETRNMGVIKRKIGKKGTGEWYNE
jgi:hypothetical protein